MTFASQTFKQGMFIAKDMEDVARCFESQGEHLKARAASERPRARDLTLARAKTYRDCAGFLRDVRFVKE